jgi:hypothetical protein
MKVDTEFDDMREVRSSTSLRELPSRKSSAIAHLTDWDISGSVMLVPEAIALM